MAFPLDEKFITDTENELNVLFPNEFKTKMIQENGGEVFTEDDNWQLYPFSFPSQSSSLSVC
ncbi:SMI1/KNR4 family protein [Vaginella massiliensis]|uniref:SMI1/KNR4 family protein n=1 Tax=Vaginella massiliensis TaxID=1816680 RepID=UPI003750071B